MQRRSCRKRGLTDNTLATKVASDLNRPVKQRQWISLRRTILTRQKVTTVLSIGLVLLTTGCASLRSDNEEEFVVRKHPPEEIETPAGQETFWTLVYWAVYLAGQFAR